MYLLYKMRTFLLINLFQIIFNIYTLLFQIIFNIYTLLFQIIFNIYTLWCKAEGNKTKQITLRFFIS